MGILSWLIVGLIAGTLAQLVIKGGSRRGCIGNIVIGVLGALIGGFIMSQLGYGSVTGLNLWSIFVAFIGSALLLLILGLFKR